MQSQRARDEDRKRSAAFASDNSDLLFTEAMVREVDEASS
jgi:hypothetical protein